MTLHRRYQKFTINNKGEFKLFSFMKVMMDRFGMKWWPAFKLGFSVNRGSTILFQTKTQNEETNIFFCSLWFNIEKYCPKCSRGIESVTSVQTVKADMYYKVFVFRRPPDVIKKGERRRKKRTQYADNQIEITIYKSIKHQ